MEAIDSGMQIKVGFSLDPASIQQSLALIKKLEKEAVAIPDEIKKSAEVMNAALQTAGEFKVTPDLENATKEMNKWFDIFNKEYNEMNQKLSKTLSTAFDTSVEDKKRNEAIIQSCNLITEYQEKSKRYATETNQEMKELVLTNGQHIANNKELVSVYKQMAQARNTLNITKADKTVTDKNVKSMTPELEGFSQKGIEGLTNSLISAKAELDLFYESVRKAFDFSGSETEVSDFMRKIVQIEEGLELLQSVGANTSFKKEATKTINSLGKEVGVTLSPQKLKTMQSKLLDSDNGIKSTTFNPKDIWDSINTPESREQIKNALLDLIPTTTPEVAVKAGQLGANMVEGVANGIEQTSKKISSSITDVGKWEDLSAKTPDLQSRQDAVLNKWLNGKASIEELCNVTDDLIQNYQELQKLGDSSSSIQEGLEDAKDFLRDSLSSEFQPILEDAQKRVDVIEETVYKLHKSGTPTSSEKYVQALKEQAEAYEDLQQKATAYKRSADLIGESQIADQYFSDHDIQLDYLDTGIQDTQQKLQSLGSSTSQSLQTSVQELEKVASTAENATQQVVELNDQLHDNTNVVPNQASNGDATVSRASIAEIEAEQAAITALKNNVNELITIVNNKTEAFSAERTVVVNGCQEESNAIKKVTSSVAQLQEAFTQMRSGDALTVIFDADIFEKQGAILEQAATKYAKSMPTIAQSIKLLSESIQSIPTDKLLAVSKVLQSGETGRISKPTVSATKSAALTSSRSFSTSGKRDLYSGKYDENAIKILGNEYKTLDSIVNQVGSTETEISEKQTQNLLTQRAAIQGLKEDYKKLIALKKQAASIKNGLSTNGQWNTELEAQFQTIQNSAFTPTSTTNAATIEANQNALMHLDNAQKLYNATVAETTKLQKAQAKAAEELVAKASVLQNYFEKKLADRSINSEHKSALASVFGSTKDIDAITETIRTFSGVQKKVLADIYGKAEASGGNSTSQELLNSGNALVKLWVQQETTLPQLTKELSVMEERLQRTSSPELITRINALKTSIAEMTAVLHQDTSSDPLNAQEVIAASKAIEDEFAHIRQEVKSTIKATNLDTSLAKLSSKYEKLANDMVIFQQKNSKFMVNPELANEFNRIFSVIRSGSNQTKTELAEMTAQWSTFQSRVVSSGNTGRSALDEIKHIYNRIGGNAIVATSIFKAGQAIRDMITNVREIDKALTDLKKVTEETDATYNRFLETAGSTAKTIGSTVTDVVSATADFARLGHTLEESTQLSKNALVYANVGDLDISTATEHMTSTLAAFNIEAKDSITIVDKFNKVGNEFAISSSGIGSALTNSAAALYGAGNDLNEAIALITGGNTVVQDPDSVGAGLRTIALRLRSSKTELADLGEETDDLIESVPKLQQKLLGLTGVNILESDNKTFKSTYEILKEIAAVYNDLDDVDAAATLELIAGKNRSNIAASILQNFSVAERAYGSAVDAAGSAEAENAKYLDSIAGKVSVLQASAESLSNSIVNSNAIKFLVDGGTKLLDITESLIDKFGTIPTLLAAISTAATLSGKNLGM